jgi:hypothetical protein
VGRPTFDHRQRAAALADPVPLGDAVQVAANPSAVHDVTDDNNYLGIFTIEVGANDAVEMPPSLLAVTPHTSG